MAMTPTRTRSKPHAPPTMVTTTVTTAAITMTMVTTTKTVTMKTVRTQLQAPHTATHNDNHGNNDNNGNNDNHEDYIGNDLKYMYSRSCSRYTLVNYIAWYNTAINSRINFIYTSDPGCCKDQLKLVSPWLQKLYQKQATSNTPCAPLAR